MQSPFIKILSIPLISLFLTACGGGSSTVIITTDRLADFEGNWQSSCRYDSNTDLTYLETLYINGTDYTIYIDEYDNSNCFGNSDYTTEIEGFLYFGNDKPYASNYCENTIEVDFTAAAIYEDNVQIPPAEISDYLNLPTNSLHDLMCTRDGELFTGDLSVFDGSSDSERPLSMNYNTPLHAY